MKLNNNCVRKVLIETENIPFGETITVERLQQKIGEFTVSEVLSVVTFLNKERYLIVLDKVSYDDNDILRDNKIKGLTNKGYQSLDLIRSDETWELLKNKLPEFNNLSIGTIFDIANKIMNVECNKIFDLPLDMMIPNTRW